MIDDERREPTEGSSPQVEEDDTSGLLKPWVSRDEPEDDTEGHAARPPMRPVDQIP